MKVVTLLLQNHVHLSTSAVKRCAHTHRPANRGEARTILRSELRYYSIVGMFRHNSSPELRAASDADHDIFRSGMPYNLALPRIRGLNRSHPKHSLHRWQHQRSQTHLCDSAQQPFVSANPRIIPSRDRSFTASTKILCFDPRSCPVRRPVPVPISDRSGLTISLRDRSLSPSIA